tara:strand:- start:103 stop:819 length:717 start_codon:yes stop_codon:yes gene_type:complete
MEQIVFFWKGKDIAIPKLLVQSIKLIENNKINIIQISDNHTPKVENVDKVIKLKLPNDIMLARLKAYSFIETLKNRTFFCDADSILLNSLQLNKFLKGIYLAKREKNFFLNYKHPELYPEFINKSAFDIMPFLFGSIIVIEEKNIFSDLLKICKRLPSRFHRWYGDQVSLHKYYIKYPNTFNFFNQDEYLHLIGSEKKYPIINIKNLLNNKVKFITFKGPQSINRIKDSYLQLKEIYS